MIDQHTLTTLEFSKIVSLIEGKCRTPYGHEAVRDYVPLFDKKEIDRKLTEISQMKDIISFIGINFIVPLLAINLIILVHSFQVFRVV